MVTDSCERICFICFEKAPSKKKKDVVFHLQIQIFNQKKKTQNSSFLLTKRPTKWSSTRSVSQRFPPKGEVLQVYDECRCRSCWGRVLSEAYTFFRLWKMLENVTQVGWFVWLVIDWVCVVFACCLCRCLCPCSCVLVFVIVFLLTCLVAFVLCPLLLRVFFRMVRQRKGGV